MAIPKIPSYPMPADIPESRVAWRFDAARAALLVHDMQDYFLDSYDRDAAPIPDAIANVRRLIDFARANGMPVYYTAQLPQQAAAERGLLTDMWGPGLTAQPGRAPICSALAPASGDVVLDKWRYSAFQRSDFESMLRGAQRDQLVICGIYAHIGCLMTACEAFMKDVQPFFVADALADFSEHEHRMALDYVARRCGKVVLARELADDRRAVAEPASIAAVAAQVAHMLQIAAADLPPHDNLLDHGLDSVRIMTLVETWRQAGRDVSFVQLAEAPTLAAWAQLLQRVDRVAA
ncbi:isochorismatase [Burkholderia sp. ABCPW 14]|uniref:isochorismatase family protein n=1 Tax=Burkholderia sp. ABCPW 14 TaxID=1637860 RepID=UPI000770D8B7|nr:isochorismatase family protein [Burkholderia sp. ABCPW 14]KVD74319.1 isochorismatase [Burkholderia sp. ABCPW 14]